MKQSKHCEVVEQSKHCEVDMILTYQFGLHIQEEVQKQLNKGWMLCAAPS